MSLQGIGCLIWKWSISHNVQYRLSDTEEEQLQGSQRGFNHHHCKQSQSFNCLTWYFQLLDLKPWTRLTQMAPIQEPCALLCNACADVCAHTRTCAMPDACACDSCCVHQPPSKRPYGLYVNGLYGLPVGQAHLSRLCPLSHFRLHSLFPLSPFSPTTA